MNMPAGEGPRPSCLRHDVIWDSLRLFDLDEEEKSNRIDLAWNPRNKYLADEVFYFDIKEHGCDQPSLLARVTVCRGGIVDQTVRKSTFHLLHFGDWGLARTMQFVVRVINSLGWVYTYDDLGHIDDNPRLESFASSGVLSPPEVIEIRESVYDVRWSFDPGTVNAARTKGYRLCWG